MSMSIAMKSMRHVYLETESRMLTKSGQAAVKQAAVDSRHGSSAGDDKTQRHVYRY